MLMKNEGYHDIQFVRVKTYEEYIDFKDTIIKHSDIKSKSIQELYEVNWDLDSKITAAKRKKEMTLSCNLTVLIFILGAFISIICSVRLNKLLETDDISILMEIGVILVVIIIFASITIKMTNYNLKVENDQIDFYVYIKKVVNEYIHNKTYYKFDIEIIKEHKSNNRGLMNFVKCCFKK